MKQYLGDINNIKKKVFFYVFLLGIIFVLFLIVGNINIKERSLWICAYTGSFKSSTTWLYIVKKDKYEKSPIEEWLQSNGKRIDHKWVKIAGSTYKIFGIYRAHSSAPPIYSFDHNSQLHFLATNSEENIESFLYFLKTKSENSQLTMICSIIKKMRGNVSDLSDNLRAVQFQCGEDKPSPDEKKELEE